MFLPLNGTDRYVLTPYSIRSSKNPVEPAVIKTLTWPDTNLILTCRAVPSGFDDPRKGAAHVWPVRGGSSGEGDQPPGHHPGVADARPAGRGARGGLGRPGVVASRPAHRPAVDRLADRPDVTVDGWRVV